MVGTCDTEKSTDCFTQIKHMLVFNRKIIKLDTSRGIGRIFPFSFVLIMHDSVKPSVVSYFA